VIAGSSGVRIRSTSYDAIPFLLAAKAVGPEVVTLILEMACAVLPCADDERRVR
jgi:hypothetical protein